MSAPRPRAYRFATEAQWKACLFEGMEQVTHERSLRLRPHALYSEPVRIESPGASAPAVVDADEILWRDGARRLQRLSRALGTPEAIPASGGMATAQRIVASGGQLWVAAEAPASLQSFDARAYTRRFDVDLSPAQVLDLTADGRGGVLVLVKRGDTWQCVRVERAGRPGEPFALAAVARPRQIAFLRPAERLVTLSEDGTRLHFFVPGQEIPERDVALNWPRPCFQAKWLVSDSRGIVFAAGQDDNGRGASAVLVFDEEGRLLQQLALGTPATGIDARRGTLLVTSGDALSRYEAGATVPDEVAEARFSLLTPMLRSPVPERLRRWLRVEARAALPAGATLEVSYASTEDKELMAQAAKIAQDRSLLQADRIRRLGDRLDWKPLAVIHGSEATAALSEHSVPLSAPLFDVRDSRLWLRVTLGAAAGAGLPELESLEVLYDAPTLMEHLPAIYRRDEERPGSFMRMLVGVLESTTQSVDARIGAIGAKAIPDSAPEEWLDFIARWVGVPWNDAMDAAQKRALMRRAPEIAAGRGTRAALEALLEALVPTQPGQPRRHRVVDVSVDLGLATAGGPKCRGSALPAVLAGLPRSALVLDRQAEIGRARLPCPGRKVEDSTSRLLGHVRVDLAATAEERRAWQPWLHGVLAAMVPATARLRLRWLSPAALHRGDRLGDEFELRDRPTPRLGTDAITGFARLPEGSTPTLSTSLNPSSRLH